jgi:hypothetical protein
MELLFWGLIVSIIYLSIQNIEMQHAQPPHLANLSKNFDREPYQMCNMEWMFFVLIFAIIIYVMFFIVKLFITPPDYRIVTLKQNV